MLDRIDVESIYPLLDRIDVESIYPIDDDDDIFDVSERRRAGRYADIVLDVVDDDDDVYLTSRIRDVPGAMPTLSILV